MDGAAAASTLGVIVEILFLDLLLSGDNAVVIALACRGLREDQAWRAAVIGAAGAVSMRLVLTAFAGVLMRLPLLQVLSAAPLLIIALNLMAGQDDDDVALAGRGRGGASILAAAGVIVVSDVAMSLDNVVALAAVSSGRFWLLAFGIIFSIPLIVFGSFGFSLLVRLYPWLADLGAALLGWVAGGMIVGDPLISGWVQSQAMALELVAPLACAIFVLLQGRFARENAAKKAAEDAGPASFPARRVVEQAAAASAPPKPVVVAATLHVAKAPAPDPAPAPPRVLEDAQGDAGDRWMIFGLAALFVVFGLFLTVVLMIPD
jgi:YjbE family integral membrane protein